MGFTGRAQKPREANGDTLPSGDVPRLVTEGPAGQRGSGDAKNEARPAGVGPTWAALHGVSRGPEGAARRQMPPAPVWEAAPPSSAAMRVSGALGFRVSVRSVCGGEIIGETNSTRRGECQRT